MPIERENITLADGTLCDSCHEWCPFTDLTKLENGALLCSICLL